MILSKKNLQLFSLLFGLFFTTLQFQIPVAQANLHKFNTFFNLCEKSLSSKINPSTLLSASPIKTKRKYLTTKVLRKYKNEMEENLEMRERSLSNNKLLEQHRLLFYNGLFYSHKGNLLGSKKIKHFIYVMDQNGNIYIGKDQYLKFHHSSFLFKKISSAGTINFKNGKITYIDNHSGHYAPKSFFFEQFINEISKIVSAKDFEEIKIFTAFDI